jgi:hypothetical protein
VSARRLEPPDGDATPTVGWLEDESEALDLTPLAQEICRHYRQEFPDEAERYGDAGNAWCVHDNLHLLNWGVEALNGYVDMRHEVEWLAVVLEARNFPIDRLARNLDLGAEVVRRDVGAAAGERLAGVLADAAAFVRSRDTFLG